MLSQVLISHILGVIISNSAPVTGWNNFQFGISPDSVKRLMGTCAPEDSVLYTRSYRDICLKAGSVPVQEFTPYWITKLEELGGGKVVSASRFAKFKVDRTYNWYPLTTDTLSYLNCGKDANTISFAFRSGQLASITIDRGRLQEIGSSELLSLLESKYGVPRIHLVESKASQLNGTKETILEYRYASKVGTIKALIYSSKSIFSEAISSSKIEMPFSGSDALSDSITSQINKAQRSILDEYNRSLGSVQVYRLTYIDQRMIEQERDAIKYMEQILGNASRQIDSAIDARKASVRNKF